MKLTELIHPRWLALTSAAAVLMLSAYAGYAATPKQPSANSQALLKAQGMVRQLGEEKAALEAEKTALQEQVKKLEEQVKQLAPLQSGLKQCQADATALKNGNQSLSASLSDYQHKYSSLQNKHQEIIGKAKQIDADNYLLVSAVKEREKWIKDCQTKNKQLISSSQELIRLYRHKSFWEKAAELEPFTGIAKVKTQDTVEHYQFKLEDLKITEFKEQATSMPTEESVQNSQP